MMTNNGSTQNNSPLNPGREFDLDVTDYILEDDLMEMATENQTPSSSKGMAGLSPELVAFISGFDCEEMEDLSQTQEANISNNVINCNNEVVPEQQSPPEEAMAPWQQLSIAPSEEVVQKQLPVAHQLQAMVLPQQLDVAPTSKEIPAITSTSNKRGSWLAHSRRRESGKYVGKLDWYYYHSDTDYIFKSMVSLKRYIETQELPKPKTMKSKSDHDVTSLPTYEKGEPSKSSAPKGNAKSSRNLAPNVRRKFPKSSAPPDKGQSCSRGLASHRKGSASQETPKRKKSNLQSFDHVNRQEKVKRVCIDKAKRDPWIPLVVKKREPVWHTKTSTPPNGDVDMKNKSLESPPVAPPDAPNAKDLESPPIAPSDASGIDDQLMEVPVRYKLDRPWKK